MTHRLPFAAALAAALLPLPCVHAALTATVVSQATRPSSSTYGAEQISGITWAGGDLYYTVDDNDGKLYPLTLAINRANGSLANSGISIGTGVTMAGSNDMEGCAFDPASGKVWISQETGALVREFDPATGELLRSAPVPAIQKQYYGNYSLEALTISGDGKTMWTANEESLKCDGTNSTLTAGTTVRLTRFTRLSVHDNWTADGQWAYLTEPIAENSNQYLAGNSRCGVSALTALPDGTLLVLERGYRGWGTLADDFKNYIYAVDFSGATDITDIPSLKEATYTRVGKTCIWKDMELKIVNYEGMCLGPRLDDGSCVLVVVADGGNSGNEKVMTLKLTGLNVRTMYFADGAGGEPSGGPYRYVNGQTVTATLPGAGSPYEAELRVHPTWVSPENGAFDEGSTATFTVTADDTLTWGAATNASLTLLAADSFERIAPDTEADALPGWSGDAWVAAGTPAQPAPAGYPLSRETHERILVVDGETERDFSNIPGAGMLLDTMIRAQRPTADSPVADVEGALALHFDLDGRLTLQHLAANGSARLRTALSERRFANGDWLRASLVLAAGDGGATWCQVRLDGEPCVTAAGVRSPDDPVSPGSWYRTLNGASAFAALSLRGFGAVDDVALYDFGATAEFADASATTNGVPYAWLTAQGLPWDPADDLDGDGFDARGEYAVGTDPWDAGDFFRIVETGFDASGRFQVRFLGSAKTSNFRVICGDDLSVPEAQWATAQGVIVRGGAGTNVWTQTGAPGEARFFRVRATLPEDAK